MQKEKQKLTVEEAYHALESQPVIFPDPDEVQSILDRVEATVDDFNNRKAMCKEIQWWWGWLSAERETMENGGVPPVIPYCLRDHPDDVVESLPMGGHYWSGWRNRVMMDPLIVAWRRKQSELHTKPTTRH